MTLDRMRELLGEEAIGKTDAELTELLDRISVIAEVVVETEVAKRRAAHEQGNKKPAAA